MNVNLKDAELACHLALHLTDLEFEMLIRERIKIEFNRAHNNNPNLGESQNSCSFTMSWLDNAEWNVAIGETYSKRAHIDGQVLSRCMHDVAQLYAMKNDNKLSLLLPAPTPVVDDYTPQIPGEDVKW